MTELELEEFWFSKVRGLEEENTKLRSALWQFDYNPFGEERGYFCVGCDMDGDDRATTPDERHDDDCRAARIALRGGK